MRTTMLSAAAAALIVTAPLHVTVSGWGAAFSVQAAAAKDGNGKGGGKGHGNDGDDGNGGRNGNAGGDGGGNGHSGKGGSKGKETTGAPDVDDAAQSPDPGDAQSFNPATGDRLTIRGRAIEVLHRNGMRESVKSGRYRMTDDKGRTIIERAATKADLRRLRNLSG